jgi:hypothetical protein
MSKNILFHTTVCLQTERIRGLPRGATLAHEMTASNALRSRLEQAN